MGIGIRPVGVITAAMVVGLVAGCASTNPPARQAGTETTRPVISAEGPEVDGPDVGPVAAPLRHPYGERFIYFVMPDRFANGEVENDTGGVEGGPLENGYLPSDKAYYHGGDLVGLTQQLDYLQGLGVSAVWITPPFTNRAVQGDGTVEGSSAGYHGYWQIDWSRIDPHLGSEDDMMAFIDAAHQRDMLVFFDVVLNHTGDVISYADDSYRYVSTSASPYLDADGNPFDPASVAGSKDFPDLDPERSFPHQPTFATPELGQIKSPDWLNDPTLYHNRGDSTFNGESNLYGDFFGLDDLFTEHPAVVQGMTDLHIDLIRRYGIDGFRVDTMKHVNDEFWASFAPAVRAAAAEAGKPDFLIFGEVVGEDAILQSSYTNLGVSSTLDFIVDGGLNRYVAGRGDGSLLAEAFDNDDWFTDADNNASMQVKFFGNHDQGRMGNAIDRANPSASDAELLGRMELGYNLLFLTRGIPVVYYGDEQGFIGRGGDQDARQDMFASEVEDYDEATIGSTATPADDNFDPSHPLYTHIAELAALRRDHRALTSGAQLVHQTEGPVFAFSRIDRDERIEYVVVTNSNASLTVPARFEPLSPSATAFVPVTVPGGDDGPELVVDENGELVVEVPPLATVMLRSAQPVPLADQAPTITLIRPEEGTEIPTPRYRLEAELDDERYAEVTFAVSIDGGQPVVVGVDDAAPYRVYWSNAQHPSGTRVEVIATVEDGSGRLRSARASTTLGDR